MYTVRFAVIGCGSIANSYHLPALCAIDEAQFVVGCDIIEERAEKTAEKFGAEAHCTDYREAVKRDDVDLVCVFTKIDSHAEIAMAAAEREKHVFLQKPFAKSLAEGLAMCAAAKPSGVEIAPSFMHRYFDECLAAAELIREGRIGDVEFLRMRNGTMNARETAPSYGGALMDIGAHGIDLIRALTGKEIARVSARLGGDHGSAPTETHSDGRLHPSFTRALLGGETNAWMQYEMSGGTVVSHEVQWSQRAGTSRFQVEVYGTEGTIFVRVPRTEEYLAVASAIGVKEGQRRADWEVPELPGRPMGQAHHEELIRSVATGEWTAQRAEDGMAVLAVCEAARRADEAGQWVGLLPSWTEASSE